MAVMPHDMETARIHYDRDPDLARALGLNGGQHEGFTGVVPYEELEDLRVTERDIPVRRQEAGE